MVENAEKWLGSEKGESDGGVLVVGEGEVGDGRVDAHSKNIRLLMNLSNLSHLRVETIPHLISSFESAFSVQLTNETKTIRDVLGQIDARLFQAYINPTVDKLSILIHDGLHAASWAPSTSPATDPSGAWRPTNAKPYMYDVLLLLVLVHAGANLRRVGRADR
ncbi:Exocyst complex component S5 [Teratosphaeriaceae sp. CCFEE 6253]|nr:Exocyst complex component S5 [Teratosphaeriaceae sp. CCFEE 6253]